MGGGLVSRCDDIYQTDHANAGRAIDWISCGSAASPGARADRLGQTGVLAVAGFCQAMTRGSATVRDQSTLLLAWGVDRSTVHAFEMDHDENTNKERHRRGQSCPPLWRRLAGQPAEPFPSAGAPGSVLAQDIGMGCLTTSE